MPSEFPPEPYLTGYFRRRLMMQPEKFGIVGSYSREALEAVVSEEFLYDQQLLRLTMSVLSGRTVSEHPEVAYRVYATWWQHLKHTITRWRLSFSSSGRSKLMTAWLWLAARTLFWVLDTWVSKRPVRTREQAVHLTFTQHVLYPEFNDIPAQFGRPVVYESLDFEDLPEDLPGGLDIRVGPSRFLNRHEIISEIYRERDPSMFGGGMSPDISLVLIWLERHGVNVDQLVKRRYP